MICVVGSLNMDLVVTADRIPAVGETIIGTGFQTISGGKGANQAVAAARMGAATTMLGRVGEDVFRDNVIQSLVEKGVDKRGILPTKEVPTGVALISVDSKGNNSIIVASGANAALKVEDVENHIHLLKEASIILLQHEIPFEVNRFVLSWAKENGKQVILNPAPAGPLGEEELSGLDFLVPNEHEIRQIYPGENKEELDYDTLAEYFISKGVGHVIITLGKDGCQLYHKEGKKSFSAYPVKAVDTTAAGDTFVGALGAGLLELNDVEKAIEFAMAAAALSVTKQGAQSSIPDRKHVLELMAAHQKTLE